MSIPASVLDAYGVSSASIESITGGLINATYKARSESGNLALALQRLHYIFPAAVNLDIEAITEHLLGKGMVTPRLQRTRSGEACLEVAGEVWRALSWVDGHCYSRVDSPAMAESGAALVGRFHRALADCEHRFLFARAGVHDTQAHLAKLCAATSAADDVLSRDASQLRNKIQEALSECPTLGNLPLRIGHGDLKISNVLFDDQGQGLCLIDLDTIGWQNIAYELGDALRSWGNPRGEDVASPQVDEDIVAAAAKGYANGAAGLLGRDEIASVVPGLETICFELAARFCLDVFEDRYFGWDATRFASRREHNLLRAKGQFALGQSVARQRQSLQALWTQAF